MTGTRVRQRGTESLVLPALLVDEVCLPGERTTVHLQWSEQRAAVEALRSGDSNGPVLVISGIRGVALDEIKIGALADIDLWSATGRLLEKVKLFVRGAATVERTSRGPFLTATVRPLAAPTGRLRRRHRELFLTYVKGKARRFGEDDEAGEASAARFISDDELVLEVAGKLWLPDSVRLALLRSRTVAAQGRLLCSSLPVGFATSQMAPEDESDASLGAELPPDIAKALEKSAFNKGYSAEREAVERLVRGMVWEAPEAQPISLARARERLDEHHGLDDVKEVVLDLLASWEWLRRNVMDAVTLRGSNLCFVGPPGVGKTSLSQAIADAMGRQLVQISMGGVDDLFLVGCAQSYTRASPGEIARRLYLLHRHPSELVFLLDEIDKISVGQARSPLAVLLALLDPVQRNKFQDQFLDMVHLDLSGALFICTANELESIPSPLRDRLQPMLLRAYSQEEQIAIAKTRLWPRVLREHAAGGHIGLRGDVIAELVRKSPRTPGMRQALAQLELIVRRALRQVLEAGEPVEIDVATALRWVASPAYDSSRIGFKGSRDSLRR